MRRRAPRPGGGPDEHRARSSNGSFVADTALPLAAATITPTTAIDTLPPVATVPPPQAADAAETTDSASEAARAVGNVAHSMIATIVGNLFPPLALLVTAPVLAHSLGVTGRGEVAGATAPLLLVTTVATFGIPQALTYAVARSPRVMRLALKHALEITAVTSAIATVAVILAANWLSGSNAAVPKLIIVASLAILPTLIVTVFRGLASGLHRWRLVAREQLISAGLELAGVVALSLTGTLTPLTATIALAFSPVTGTLAYLSLRHSAPPPVVPESDLGSRNQMFNYGLRVWVGAVSGTVLSRIDQTLMTSLASSRQLGLYATGVIVAQIPLVINSAVRDVTYSADAADDVNERLGLSARISSSACAVVGLFVGVTMIWWLPLLFGQEFSPAIRITAVLIVAVVLGTPGSIAGAGLAARGRPGLRSSSLVVASIVNVILVFVLVPRYGAMGAAFATLVGNLLSSNGNILLLWRVFGVNPLDVYGLRRNDIKAVRGFIKTFIDSRSPAQTAR